MNEIPNHVHITNKIENCDGWKLSEKLSELTVSYSVYGSNYRELKKLFEWCSEETEFQTYWYMQNGDKCDDLLLEIARCSHNYFSSVLSLKENTRSVIRKISRHKNEMAHRYQKLVDSVFLNNEFSVFCQELRNFTTHSAIPRIKAHFRMHPSVNEPSGIYIEINRLREWDRWTAPSKRYLSRQKNDIPLKKICDDYNALVVGFMNDLSSQVNSVFNKEFKELRVLQDELLSEHRRNGVPIDAILEKRWSDIDK